MIKHQQESNRVEAAVRIEEWLLLILLGLIPVVNLITFCYLSFNSKVNTNKRHFAIAALIYSVIIIVLVLLTTWLL
ncbi:MAG: hypothetical protein K2G70_05385 [Turicibacter sp.]|nr:hypothetical protein [Turicibacter sp.]